MKTKCWLNDRKCVIHETDEKSRKRRKNYLSSPYAISENPCNVMLLRSYVMHRSLLFICNAFASNLAPTSPIWFPLHKQKLLNNLKFANDGESFFRFYLCLLNHHRTHLMSMFCKHWLLPSAFITLYNSPFNLESASESVWSTQSSSWNLLSEKSKTLVRNFSQVTKFYVDFGSLERLVFCMIPVAFEQSLPWLELHVST